jgi:hypothetical protein
MVDSNSPSRLGHSEALDPTIRAELLAIATRKRSRLLTFAVPLLAAAGAGYYLRSIAFPRGADLLLAAFIGVVVGLLLEVLVLRGRLNAIATLLSDAAHEG